MTRFGIFVLLGLALIVQSGLWAADQKKPEEWTLTVEGKEVLIVPVVKDGRLYLPVPETLDALRLPYAVDWKSRLVSIPGTGKAPQISPYLMKDIRKVTVLPFKDEVIKARQDSIIYPDGAEIAARSFASALFSKDTFVIVPNELSEAEPQTGKIVELGSTKDLEGVLVGKVKRYEYRADTESFFPSYGVEASVQIQLLETKSGTVVWQAEETMKNTSFNALNAGSDSRRRKLLKELLEAVSEKMATSLVEFKRTSVK
ncbi:MAG: hypothetical protein HYU64_04925 [Armatimonadetes bacterium]|nr:hypothetical protein [Armatimonadota bacterium]